MTDSNVQVTMTPALAQAVRNLVRKEMAIAGNRIFNPYPRHVRGRGAGGGTAVDCESVQDVFAVPDATADGQTWAATFLATDDQQGGFTITCQAEEIIDCADESAPGWEVP